MCKPAGVLFLVAGLLLTAIPAALVVEDPCLSPSSDAASWSHAQVPGVQIASPVESVEETEVDERDTIQSVADGAWLRGMLGPVFHLRATHARNAHRSRVPAVIHGHSPPC